MALAAAQRPMPKLKAPPKAEKAYVFNLEGTDSRGGWVKSETCASSITTVRADLRRQGVNPIKIKKNGTSIFSGRKKIRPGDIAIFSRQLATMMAVGVPLVQSFDIVGRGHDNAAMQDLILAIKQNIESGTAMAEAMGKHLLYFNGLFCNLVGAGLDHKSA